VKKKNEIKSMEARVHCFSPMQPIQANATQVLSALSLADTAEKTPLKNLL